MRERDIENYLVVQVAKLNGKAYKWQSMSNKAVPDRLCFFPEEIIKLVECKAPGKEATPLQKKIHKVLRLMGFDVLVIDTKEKIDVFIDIVKEEIDEFRSNI